LRFAELSKAEAGFLQSRTHVFSKMRIYLDLCGKYVD
jgi:hypothetical protein